MECLDFDGASRKTKALLTQFSDSDILFLVETVDPGLVMKVDIVKGDPALIEGMLDQETHKLFQRIMLMDDERIIARITPRFLFEVLLKRLAVRHVVVLIRPDRLFYRNKRIAALLAARINFES